MSPSAAARTASPTARDIFDAVCEIRRAKLPDPAVTGNAGSFFKNPIVSAARRDELLARFPGLVSYAQPDGGYKLAAGWLIDQCGWKGRSLGAAGVHDRQALVLVNRGGATAADIMAAADSIIGHHGWKKVGWNQTEYSVQNIEIFIHDLYAVWTLGDHTDISPLGWNWTP